MSDLPNPALSAKLARWDNVSAADATSSHWSLMHQSSRVALLEKEDSPGIMELEGRGFGEIQRRPAALLPFEWMTSLLHAATLPRKSELLSGLQKLRRLLGRQVGQSQLSLSYDAVRQLFVWHMLRPHLPAKRPLRFAMIGDGFGILSALIKEDFPESRFFLIDLPKTLVFQSVYIQRMQPRCSHALLDEARDADFVYCPAPQLPWKQAPIDIFVNVNSMQEMKEETIRGYFAFFKQVASEHNRFYCCNRVEKRLPGGEVIRFKDYPWDGGDEIIFDEPCSFQRFYLHPRTLPGGPRILGIRVPFVNSFDGDHWHRLVRLARKEDARLG